MSRRKPILCLDFDGVIHSYKSGWRGPRVIPDPPVKGAMAFIVLALGVFDVHVYSSRSHYWFGIWAMRRWLFVEMAKHLGSISAAAKVMEQIGFPKSKPPAMVTIDDRALTFGGTWPSLESLKAFKPWNK